MVDVAKGGKISAEKRLADAAGKVSANSDYDSSVFCSLFCERSKVRPVSTFGMELDCCVSRSGGMALYVVTSTPYQHQRPQ